MGFLAAGHRTAPFVHVYDAGTLADAAGFSAAAITDWATDVAFSPNGEYLAVGQVAEPRLKVYSTVDWSVAFSASVPALIGGLAFSSDSARLIVTYNTAPFCTVYTAGVWTTTTAPTLTSSLEVSVDPKGGLVAFCGAATLQVFSDPAWVLQGGYTVTGMVQSTRAAFNPILAELVLVYSDVTDTRVIVMDTTDGSEAVASVAVTGATGVAVDATGVYAAVTRFDTPYLSVFDASSLSTVPVAAPPAGISRAVAFDGSGTRMVVGGDNSPRLSLYSTPAFTALTPPASEPTGRVLSLSYGGDFVAPITELFWTNRIRTQEII